MTYSNLSKGVAAVIAALSLLCSCNKESSSLTPDAPLRNQVAFDFSSYALATRSLPSTFATSLNFDYYTFSPTAEEWIASPYVKKHVTGSPSVATITIVDGSPFASDMWLSPGQRIGGVLHSAGLAYDVNTSDEVTELRYAGTWDATAEVPTAQLFYTPMVNASYDTPTITAQLTPTLNSYDFSDIVITCANPNLKVETTATVTYTVPSNWKLQPIDGVLKVVLTSSKLGIANAYKNTANGVQVLKSSNAADKVTFSTAVSNTTPVFLPAVRQAKVNFSVKVLGQDDEVLSTNTFQKTYDLYAYNAELTAYKFSIHGTVDAGGGPLDYDLSVKELSVSNVSFDDVTITKK